jgi:hypothetical protein
VGDGEGGEDVRCYLESLRLEESPILFCMYRLKCFQVNQLHRGTLPSTCLVCFHPIIVRSNESEHFLQLSVIIRE